jgi:hypothetical protein
MAGASGPDVVASRPSGPTYTGQPVNPEWLYKDALIRSKLDSLGVHWLKNYPSLARAYLDAWSADEDPLAAVRAHSDYDLFFAGNRRDDGSVRYSEGDYLALVESFATTLRNVGIEPRVFEGRFGELVSGSVGADEFRARIGTLESRVLSRADDLRAFYGELMGVEGANLTDAQLLASALDPTMTTDILEGRIDIALVGVEGRRAGFDISTAYATALEARGLDPTQAQQTFVRAANQLPILDLLAQRHLDPDDDFDIGEFIEGVAFGDPRQLRRMNRLLQAEAASFSSRELAERSRDAVVGLEAR